MEYEEILFGTAVSIIPEKRNSLSANYFLSRRGNILTTTRNKNKNKSQSSLC